MQITRFRDAARRSGTRLVFLLTVAVAAPLQAQEEATPAEPAAQPRAEEAPLEEGGEGGVLLDDYEASEQISEDLSVSFPVDI